MTPAKTKKLQNIYLQKFETRLGYDIWIVDGNTVRLELYDEFLLGGNDQRYAFVPSSEIWIDGYASCLEYEYTTIHEIFECNLMRDQGMTYSKSHELALIHEIDQRKIDRSVCEENAKITGLSNIYHKLVSEKEGIKIWIVDGAVVREDLYSDFCYSGNGESYKFIPKNEIWIDLHISAFELRYQIAHQLDERKGVLSGAKFEDAYVLGTKAGMILRKEDLLEVARKEEDTKPVELGAREKGVKI